MVIFQNIRCLMIGLQYSEGVWYMYFLALDETKDVVKKEIQVNVFLV